MYKTIMMNASRFSSCLGPIVWGTKFPHARLQRRVMSSESVKASGGNLTTTSLPVRLWEAYTAALLARPLTVKACTASFIFVASDSTTQYLMHPDEEYDVARAGSGAAFGVVATTWLHHWWGFLEGFVGKRLPVRQHRLSNTLVKVFLDQSIGAPLYIFSYYVITNFIQEYNALPPISNTTPWQLLQETSERAAEMLPPTMIRHWTLWPAVHTLNFYYSPLHHRVLVQNMVLVGWSGYLSHLNNGGLMTPTEEVEETIEIKRRATEVSLTRS